MGQSIWLVRDDRPFVILGEGGQSGCADVSVTAGRNLEPAAGDGADKGNAAVN